MIHQDFTDFGKWSAAAVASQYTIEVDTMDANRRLAWTIGGDMPRDKRGHFSVNLNRGELDAMDAEALKKADQTKESTPVNKQPPPVTGGTDSQAIQRVSGKNAVELQQSQSSSKTKQRQRG